MVDHHIIASLHVIAGLHHSAARCGQDCLALRRGNVDSGVSFTGLAARLPPGGTIGVGEADGVGSLHRPLEETAGRLIHRIDAVEPRVFITGQLGQEDPAGAVCVIFHLQPPCGQRVGLGLLRTVSEGHRHRQPSAVHPVDALLIRHPGIPVPVDIAGVRNQESIAHLRVIALRDGSAQIRHHLHGQGPLFLLAINGMDHSFAAGKPVLRAVGLGLQIVLHLFSGEVGQSSAAVQRLPVNGKGNGSNILPGHLEQTAGVVAALGRPGDLTGCAEGQPPVGVRLVTLPRVSGISRQAEGEAGQGCYRRAALSGLSAANGPQRYRTYHQRQCTGGAYCRPEHRAPLSGRQMFGAGRLLLRSRRLPGGGQHPVIQPGGGLDMLHQILIVVLLHGRLLPAGL